MLHHFLRGVSRDETCCRPVGGSLCGMGSKRRGVCVCVRMRVRVRVRVLVRLRVR